MLEFICFTLGSINRDDQSEGGNGRPRIGGVCGEEKSWTGEASADVFIVVLCLFCASSLLYLYRYLQRIVSHPSLLQDPDVREFLEREDVGV